MIKITRPSDIRKTTRSTKSAPSGDTFAPAASSSGQPTDTSELQSAGPTETLSALIALQADQGGGAKTFAAAQRILDALDGLQLMVLTGQANEEDLNALRQTAELRAHAEAEPALLDIYDQISLRAKVELAKLERFER